MNYNLEDKLYGYITALINRYPILEKIQEDIIAAYQIMEDCYKSGGKLLIAGNGGSAADAEHIVGELMKGFKFSRKTSKDFANELIHIDGARGQQLAQDLQGALPAISLTSHLALSSAFLNDVSGVEGFAQQVYGYGRKEDVLLAISTSGNSENIMYATVVARAKGMKVIGLTGDKGGELANVSDVAVKAPLIETYMIQELHLPIYHCWCLMLEEKFFNIEGE